MYRTVLALFFLAVPVFGVLGLALLGMGLFAAVYVQPFSVATVVRLFVAFAGFGFLVLVRKFYRAGRAYLDTHDYAFVAFASCVVGVVLAAWLKWRFPEVPADGLILVAAPSLLWGVILLTVMHSERFGPQGGKS